MSSKMMVFTGNSNPDLARKVASRLYLELGSAKVGKFSDGEITVELNENVRGKDVFVLQSTCEPTNDNLMEFAHHRRPSSSVSRSHYGCCPLLRLRETRSTCKIVSCPDFRQGGCGHDG